MGHCRFLTDPTATSFEINGARRRELKGIPSTGITRAQMTLPWDLNKNAKLDLSVELFGGY